MSHYSDVLQHPYAQKGTCPYCGYKLLEDEKRGIRYCPHCSMFAPELLFWGDDE